MRKLVPLIILCGAVALTGCVSNYSGFDHARLEAGPAPAHPSPGLLRYSIYGNSLLNGQIGVREVLDREAPFARKEQITAPAQADGSAAPAAIPTKGLYVKATIENVPPSVPAGIAAYVSLATLFLVPFWSTQDGARLLFDVYRDGEQQRRFEYGLHRHTYGWAPLLLLSWVNAFTPSEQEAFQASTRQFLSDAAPLLQSR